LSRFRGTFHSFDPVGFAIFAILVVLGSKAPDGERSNGMIMESAAFLAKTKKPTEAQVKDALANNLCRCGTHARIVKAVMRAAGA
jgi:xanthine dehydrogenase iron-sulfur cluster and FAD-binding subunit A